MDSKTQTLVGSCNYCGECCRDIVIFDGKKFIRTEEDFKKLIENDEYYRMFEISIREPFRLFFTCTNLGADNRCQRYGDRPQLCKDYPNKDMLMKGTVLPKNCGYELKEE